MTSIQKIRQSMMQAQDGRCFYCGQPMWADHPGKFRAAFRIAAGDLRNFRCTAEHLTARCDGGKDKAANIVAACWFCNTMRHRAKQPLPPAKFRARVRKRVAKGQWTAGRMVRPFGPS